MAWAREVHEEFRAKGEWVAAVMCKCPGQEVLLF